MRHCDLTGLSWVLEVVVGTDHVSQLPTIGPELLDEVCAVHVCNLTHIHNVV